jgi:hypothetical protein
LSRFWWMRRDNRTITLKNNSEYLGGIDCAVRAQYLFLKLVMTSG